jgi:hypothetical protein
MFVCCVCVFVFSDRGLCDELITRPRGVPLTVARRCVWSRNLVWRGAHSPRWAAEPEKIINNNRVFLSAQKIGTGSCKIVTLSLIFPTENNVATHLTL